MERNSPNRRSAREEFPNGCSCGFNYSAANISYIEHLRAHHLDKGDEIEA